MKRVEIFHLTCGDHQRLMGSPVMGKESLMSLLFAFLLLLGAGEIPASPATAPSDARVQTFTRTFDVHSLALSIPDYPLEPSMVPGADQSDSNRNGGTPPSEPSADPVDSLRKLIQENVAPDSWRDNGGGYGAMTFFQGRLVVTQTQENLDKIQKLLDSVAATSPAMLRVNAVWVWLKPEQVQALRDQFHGSADSIMTVDEKTLSQFEIYTRGQTPAFEGQTVHISSITEHRYVSDATPVVGTGAAAYSVTVSTLKSGVALQVTPRLLSDGSLRLDLLNIVADVRGIADGSISLPVGDTTLPSATSIIERPTTQTGQIHTTVRMPLGKNVVIGGMPINRSGAPAAVEQLYLIVDVEASK
jgi:hypothetical protein